jgi:3-oxoadipate enol-lactonase
VIVLVHSGVCDNRMWDGFDVPGAIRHEIRGFGQTPMPRTGRVSNSEDLAETLGGRPAALVGASYGGWVCLQLAVARPELVTDLVLMGAPLPDHDWSEEIEELRREEERLAEEEGDLRAAAILNADFWLESPEPRERVIEMQERAFELQLGSEADVDEPESVDLSAITARTLVVVGELDKPDFHEIGARMAREIPGAQHEIVPGAGHLSALERPEHTARLVRDFLGLA